MPYLIQYITFFVTACSIGALGNFFPNHSRNTTVLLIGQNWMDEYKDYVTGTNVPSAGASFYTLQLEQGQPLTWMGDGMSFLNYLHDNYPGSYAELTLAWKYAPGGCSTVRQYSLDIAEGKYDSQLNDMVKVFISMPNITFLLRVEYEVSYSLFTCKQTTGCTDTTYQTAFKHIVQYIKPKATNAKFVFHVMYGANDAPCLYPGDDVVDIIGVSFFEGKNDPCYKKNVSCVNPNVAATLQWAQNNAPTKPVMFPESTPQDVDLEWFLQFLGHMTNMINKYNVWGWTFINQNWPAHGWQGWSDTRVQAFPSVLDYWKQNVLSNDRYICLGGKPCSEILNL